MKLVLFSLVLIHAGPAAADLDAAQTQGLADTQRLLRTSSERERALRNDPSARTADAKVDALTGGGAQKDAVYGISADVMEKLTKQSNGDPVKMQEVLGEALKNPEGFYNQYFDESAKSKVRGVAGSVNQPATTPKN